MTNFVFTSFHSQISLGATVQWPAGSQPGQGTPSPEWYLISVSREAGNRAELSCSSLVLACLGFPGCDSYLSALLCRDRLTQPELDSSSLCFNSVCEQDTRVSTQQPQISLWVFTLKTPNKSEQLLSTAYTNLPELIKRERFNTNTHKSLFSPLTGMALTWKATRLI